MALQFRESELRLVACDGLGVAVWRPDSRTWWVGGKPFALKVQGERLLSDAEARASYPDADFNAIPRTELAAAGYRIRSELDQENPDRDLALKLDAIEKTIEG